MTGTITIHYGAADRIERLEAAAIVRGDGERLRGVLRALDERLRRVARGKAEVPALQERGAEVVLEWIDELRGDLPLSLED